MTQGPKGFFRVVQWDHKYADPRHRGRRPGHFRLDADFFSDPDLNEVPDSQKLPWVAILTMAAKHGNCVPEDAAFIKKVCGLRVLPNLALFRSLGLTEPAVRNRPMHRHGSRHDVTDRSPLPAPPKERSPRPPKEITPPDPPLSNGLGADAPGGAAVVALPKPKVWSNEAIDDFRELRGHLGAKREGRIPAALKPCVDGHGWKVVRPLWRAWLGSSEGKFGPESFAMNFEALLRDGSLGGPPTRAGPQTLWDRQRAENEAFRRGGK